MLLSFAFILLYFSLLLPVSIPSVLLISLLRLMEMSIFSPVTLVSNEGTTVSSLFIIISASSNIFLTVMPFFTSSLVSVCPSYILAAILFSLDAPQPVMYGKNTIHINITILFFIFYLISALPFAHNTMFVPQRRHKLAFPICIIIAGASLYTGLFIFNNIKI